MKLYHATPKENAESILKRGIDNRRRTFIHGGQRTKALRQFIDKRGTGTAKTEDAIFFFLSDQLEEVQQNYAEYYVFSVDASELNSYYLVAFNHAIAVLIDDLWQAGNCEEAAAWADVYWKTAIDLKSYMQQQEAVNQLSLERMNLPFIPEVLYFGKSIPAEKIKLL